MNDNVEIIKSNKGGMKIIHRGYMYTVHKRRIGGGIRWRCTQRSLHCKGSISTGNGSPTVNMPHNHIPDPHSVALARCKQPEDFPDINSLLETEYDETKDSMPLQQRMVLGSPPHIDIPSSSEPLFQNQPLSSPKLKVTRQSTRLQMSAQKVNEPQPEEVCLRWNSHHSNIQTTFPKLLANEQYVDVTIIAEDKVLKCHRMILSSCSSYFEQILSNITPMQHPVIILKETPFWILKALIDFMYAGEISIDQNKLPQLLETAELLKVKGLAGKSNSTGESSEQENISSQKENGMSPENLKKPKIEDVPISDPLDLLEPSFQEETAAKKAKDSKLPFKRGLIKRIKRRRSSDEEYSPPMFPMRRGTRSRPNVKVPKYYDYEDIVKPTTSDTPPTLQPAIKIKTEPVDADDADSYNGSNTDPEDGKCSMEIMCINPNSLEKNPLGKDAPIYIKSKLKDTEPKIPSLYKIKIKPLSSLSNDVKNKKSYNKEDFDFQKTAATISLVVQPSQKENVESGDHTGRASTAEEKDPLANTERIAEETNDRNK